MTTTTERVAQALPVFARGPVLALAAVVAAVLTAVSGRYGYFGDELYVIAAGHHLAWGYADQPPLLPLLALVADTVAPGSVMVLRIPATLATVVVIVLAALTAREFGGGRRAQLIAAGTVAVSPIFLGGGHLLATSTLDPVLWAAVTFLVVRWLRTGSDRLLLVAGIVTAVDLQVKFLGDEPGDRSGEHLHGRDARFRAGGPRRHRAPGRHGARRLRRRPSATRPGPPVPGAHDARCRGALHGHRRARLLLRGPDAAVLGRGIGGGRAAPPGRLVAVGTDLARLPGHRDLPGRDERPADQAGVRALRPAPADRQRPARRDRLAAVGAGRDARAAARRDRGDPTALASAFGHVTPVGAVDNDVRVNNLTQGTPMFLLEGRHESWAQVWARVRHR